MPQYTGEPHDAPIKKADKFTIVKVTCVSPFAESRKAVSDWGYFYVDDGRILLFMCSETDVYTQAIAEAGLPGTLEILLEYPLRLDGSEPGANVWVVDDARPVWRFVPDVPPVHIILD